MRGKFLIKPLDAGNPIKASPRQSAAPKIFKDSVSTKTSHADFPEGPKFLSSVENPEKSLFSYVVRFFFLVCFCRIFLTLD